MAVFCCSFNKNWVNLAFYDITKLDFWGGNAPPPQKVGGQVPPPPAPPIPPPMHGYFVVSSPYERFRNTILLVAITVTWSDTPACAVLFLPTQQVRSIADREWCYRSVGVWPPSDWQVINGNTYSWLCHRSSCIFKEAMREFFITVAIINR